MPVIYAVLNLQSEVHQGNLVLCGSAARKEKKLPFPLPSTFVGGKGSGGQLPPTRFPWIHVLWKLHTLHTWNTICSNIVSLLLFLSIVSFLLFPSTEFACMCRIHSLHSTRVRFPRLQRQWFTSINLALLPSLPPSWLHSKLSHWVGSSVQEGQ